METECKIRFSRMTKKSWLGVFRVLRVSINGKFIFFCSPGHARIRHEILRSSGPGDVKPSLKMKNWTRCSCKRLFALYRLDFTTESIEEGTSGLGNFLLEPSTEMMILLSSILLLFSIRLYTPMHIHINIDTYVYIYGEPIIERVYGFAV